MFEILSRIIYLAGGKIFRTLKVMNERYDRQATGYRDYLKLEC